VSLSAEGLKKISGTHESHTSVRLAGNLEVFSAAAAASITKRIGGHTLRHTFSTLIKSLGVDAKVVQELMRHASFRTTMDSYTQALDKPKPGARAPSRPDHAHRETGSRMIVVDCL
jgi:integrase